MKTWLSLLVLLLSTAFTSFGQDRQQCLIVLDASNSMSGYKKGKLKMRIAQEVIGNLVATMPDNIDLGLVIYGHRKKSDCDDIELMIPPAPLNQRTFMQTVNSIRANGKTPLTNSIEFAAHALGTSYGGGSIILLTDGLETCRRDPCEAVAALVASGIQLTAHVVAFDLSANQAQQIKCIADQTGGQLLEADDASSLFDALNTAITVVASGPIAAPVPQVEIAPPQPTVTVAQSPSEPSIEPALEEDLVTLTVPESVAAGSDFLVGWEGPSKPGDFITITPEGWDEDRWKNNSYVREDNPLWLKALIDPQTAEVRYVSGKTNKILGRANILIVEALATVSGPAEAVQGNTIPIEWTGPANDGDFITIVPKDAEPGMYIGFKYTEKGTPVVKVRGLPDVGPGEIRYITGQERRTLASAEINFVEAVVSLSAQDEAIAGSSVTIEWEGPANDGDYITIVPKESAEGKYLKYAYTKSGELQVKVTAPMKPGESEIRYIAGNSRTTMARIPILIKEAEVSVTAPMEAIAGSEVRIQWEGPANSGDFITIVSKWAEEKTYTKVNYANPGNTILNITAPMEIGESEIRYLAGSGRQTLARIPILIKAAEVVLKAPREATVGNRIRVEWEGPANKGDFITLVNKSAAERYYKNPVSVARGRPFVELVAPMQAGDMEIRYLAGANRETLGRITLTLLEPKVEIHPPDTAMPGELISIRWAGPQNQNDYLIIVPASSPDGQSGPSAYTNQGSPASLRVPQQPGRYEVRYISGQGRKVLGRTAIEIEATEQ